MVASQLPGYCWSMVQASVFRARRVGPYSRSHQSPDIMVLTVGDCVAWHPLDALSITDVDINQCTRRTA